MIDSRTRIFFGFGFGLFSAKSYLEEMVLILVLLSCYRSLALWNNVLLNFLDLKYCIVFSIITPLVLFWLLISSALPGGGALAD